MAEQSDAFKQLDAVGKSRYNEKLGMLGITTDPYMTPKDAWDYNPSRWPDEHNKCNALRVHDIRRRYISLINLLKASLVYAADSAEVT
ncbi:hypothetical protein EMCRGX_G000607 [Ephydatia muelleri]